MAIWRPEESVLERPSFQLVEGPGLQALSGRFGGTGGKQVSPGGERLLCQPTVRLVLAFRPSPAPAGPLPGMGWGPPVPHILLLGEQPLKPGSPD